MKSFKLPSLPANCFGLALGTISEEFEGSIEKFDRHTLWFKGKNGKPGRGYRGEIEEVVKSSADTLSPVVSDAVPGSAERIEAMKEFYAGGESESAFEISDEEIADRLSHTYAKLLKSAISGGNSLKAGAGEVVRENRRLSE